MPLTDPPDAGLRPEMPLPEAVARMVRGRLAGVESSFKTAVESTDGDPQPIHKLRVATRRLATTLQAFSDELPARTASKLDSVLDEIRRECGAARDLDVQRLFLERLLSEADSTELAVVDLLYERATIRREELVPKLSRRLERFQPRLAKVGGALVKRCEARRDRTDVDRGTFGEAARRMLIPALSGLTSDRDLNGASSRELHELRLAGKRLRYACELFEPILGADFDSRFGVQMAHLQDLLGEVHDAEVAQLRYWALRQKWNRDRHKRSWDRKPQGLFSWRDLRTGLKFVVRAYRRKGKNSKQEFQEMWPGFIGDEFQLPLERLLRDLSDLRDSA